MSHQIEQFSSNRAAFVSVREHAWHRLGTVVDHALSAEEALELAHLSGWNVRKAPLQALQGEESAEALQVPGSFATVRTHPITGRPEVLGVVGNRYTPIQNEEHAGMLNALLHESRGQFETAGSLRGGKEVFVTTRIPAQFNVGGVDPVDLYLVAMNSHDGSSPFRFLVTTVRVVCANTLAAALGQARSSFAIKHTRSYRSNIAAAQQALELSFTYRDAFAVEAERMINEAMSPGSFRDTVEELFPTPADSAPALAIQRDADRKRSLLELFEASPTMTEITGTRWAGYQAITEYLDHFARTQANRWTTDENEARALRAVSPALASVKERAFALMNIG